jgi:nucleoside diphosphate kinase
MVMLQTLEGEDAIAKNREVMGATNPAIRAVAACAWTQFESKILARCVVRGIIDSPVIL